MTSVIEIIPDKGNIKRKEKFSQDIKFNQLSELSLNYLKKPFVHRFIRTLFYFKDSKKYEELYKNFITKYEWNIDELSLIYNLFIEWKPFEKYDLGECRGYFLELFSFKLLKEQYPKINIYEESRIKYMNYNSHVWDFIIILDSVINFYECKFSPRFIKRSHIDQMVGLTSVLEKSKIFLICYDFQELLIDSLYLLQKETSSDRFNEILNKINIITIDDFNQGNPF